MAEQGGWRSMASAPKDGSRILVTVRSAEQGPAEVDVAYWARTDGFGIEGWRAADSHPGLVIAYADPELQCWMPLPTASPAAGSGLEDERPTKPAPWDGEKIAEVDGSGI